MEKGKQKCEYLRTIRRKLAEANGIVYEPHECTHEGPCPGTCPLCDRELLELQQQLDLLEQNGGSVCFGVLSPEEVLFLAQEDILSDPDDDGELMGDLSL